MHLVSFHTIAAPGTSRAGALLDNGSTVLDLARADAALSTDLMDILGGGQTGLDRVRAAIDRHDPAAECLYRDVVLDAPVPRPGKIVCIGYNYLGHTQDDAPLPERPDVFVKTVNTIVGPGASVVVPRESSEVDYEAELAVVIGVPARRVSPSHALDYVAGYSIFNDLSARDWQRRGSQWTLGKSFDGFGPFGPALVTADEVGDPQRLDIELAVNGEVTVRSTTERMIFPVADLIAYISDVMTLEPGDVIATGTPQKLPQALAEGRWLTPGDHVEIAISKLGTLSTSLVADAA